jgi:hypothetical protein
VNTNVSFPVIVAQMVPVSLLADYHLMPWSSTTYAVNKGTAPSASAAVPTRDIDGQTRPQSTTDLTDRGADEITGPAVAPAAPTVFPVNDPFNTNNTTGLFNLGNGWSVSSSGGQQTIRKRNGQAEGMATVTRAVRTSGFVGAQVAGFEFGSTGARSGDALILKADPSNSTTYLRVRVTSSGVTVERVTPGGTTVLGTFAASFVVGDRLIARANTNGSVDVWKVSGSTTTYLGTSNTSASTGGGQIGMILANGARINSFFGGVA